MISGFVCFNGVGCDFMLVCFNKDGMLDVVFGENGYVFMDIFGFEDWVYVMGFDLFGGVYVVGGVMVELGLIIGNYVIIKYLMDLFVDFFEFNDIEGSVLIYFNLVLE